MQLKHYMKVEILHSFSFYRNSSIKYIINGNYVDNI